MTLVRVHFFDVREHENLAFRSILELLEETKGLFDVDLLYLLRMLLIKI